MLEGVLSFFYKNFSLHLFSFIFTWSFSVYARVFSSVPEHAQRQEGESASTYQDGFQAPSPFHITAFCRVQPDVLPDKTKHRRKHCKWAAIAWWKPLTWSNFRERKTREKWGGEACSGNYPKLPFLEAGSYSKGHYKAREKQMYFKNKKEWVCLQLLLKELWGESKGLLPGDQ